MNNKKNEGKKKYQIYHAERGRPNSRATERSKHRKLKVVSNPYQDRAKTRKKPGTYILIFPFTPPMSMHIKKKREKEKNEKKRGNQSYRTHVPR